MKKLLLLLIFLSFLMVINFANAQNYTYDSLCHYYMGNYYPEFHNILGLRDGGILFNLGLRNYDEQGGYISDYGQELVKLVQNEERLFVAESGFIPDEYVYSTMMERDAKGDGNLLVDIDRDFDNLTATLHIRHFNDALDFDEGTDIFLLLEDTLFLYHDPWTNDAPELSLQGEQFLFDGGDIILRYTILTQDPFVQPPFTSPYVTVFARIGTDGTIKDKTVFPSTQFDPSHRFFYFGFFNESPREYFLANRFYANNEPFMELCLIDSMFCIQRIDTIDGNLPGNLITDFQMCHVMSLDESSYIVASEYDGNSIIINRGVHVTKYDKATHTILANTCFPTIPFTEHYGSAHCLGLERTADGNVFFAHCTQDRMAGYVGQIGVAKLDADMNVIWLRYCLEPTGYIHEVRGSKNTQVLYDGRFVVGAVDFAPGEMFASPFFLVFTDNGSADVHEMEPFVRPYAFGPNPVHDELHLQYSPDVQPACIELYDLQGRLIQTQTQSLESLRLEGLAAGQYLMKVTMKDGQAFTDKVVKE